MNKKRFCSKKKQIYKTVKYKKKNTSILENDSKDFNNNNNNTTNNNNNNNNNKIKNNKKMDTKPRSESEPSTKKVSFYSIFFMSHQISSQFNDFNFLIDLSLIWDKPNNHKQVMVSAHMFWKMIIGQHSGS